MPLTTPFCRCCRRGHRHLRLTVPGDAAEGALTMVTAVRHDPALRLQLASSFYDPQPRRGSIRPYRRAELAFMRWQVRRGVLASPESPGPAASGGARSTKACCATPGKLTGSPPADQDRPAHRPSCAGLTSSAILPPAPGIGLTTPASSRDISSIAISPQPSCPRNASSWTSPWPVCCACTPWSSSRS